jgi:hypothetical protein
MSRPNTAPSAKNFAQMTQSEAMQAFGENRSPIRHCNFTNAQFTQGYNRSQQMSAAGRPMVLRADGTPVDYRCRRPQSSPGIRSPGNNHNHPAMITEPPPPWTPVTGLRPGSAHRVQPQWALRHQGQSASTYVSRPPAGILGPRSFTAWRPPSSSKSKRPVRLLVRMHLACGLFATPNSHETFFFAESRRRRRISKFAAVDSTRLHWIRPWARRVRPGREPYAFCNSCTSVDGRLIVILFIRCCSSSAIAQRRRHV